MADPFDHAALRAYIARHELTEPAMAAHAGIPYRTLRGVLVGREPSSRTRSLIELSLGKPPPPKRLPHHGQAVADAWSSETVREIGRRLGISHQRVSFIAKKMELPRKLNCLGRRY